MANSSLYNSLISKSKNHGFKGGSFKNINARPNILNLLREKQRFLAMVFLNLIIQLGITYYFMTKNQTSDNFFKGFWGLIIIIFIIIFILAFIPMPPYLKFIIFCIFSYIFGLLLSIDKFNPILVKSTIISVMAIFITMFAFGTVLITFGINLTPKIGFLLLSILLLLIIMRIINLFIPSQSTFKYLSVFTIFLFSVFIIYDTNIILQRDYSGDFITASIDYYLDILNIFINLINIQN